MPSEQLNVYIGNQECTSNSSSFQVVHKMLNYLEMPSEQLNVYIRNQECTSNSSSFQGVHKMLNYLEMSSEHLEYMSCGMMCIFWQFPSLICGVYKLGNHLFTQVFKAVSKRCTHCFLAV